MAALPLPPFKATSIKGNDDAGGADVVPRASRHLAGIFLGLIARASAKSARLDSVHAG